MVGNFLLLMGRIGVQRMRVPSLGRPVRGGSAHDPLDAIDGEHDLRRRLVLGGVQLDADL
jgi:hypothetical protein